MKFLYLFALVVMLSVSVSAWPYELYSNGTIVDLNSSNNQSTNLTIYYYNVTNTNTNTNITNNVTNITQVLNDTYYNTTESDARYLRTGSQYGNTELFNRAEINERLNNLTTIDANITAQLDEINETPVGWLWAGIILAVFLAGTALILLIGKENY